MKPMPSASKKLSVAGVYAALTVVSLIMLVPFLWMLSTSFKQPQDIFTYPPQLIPPVFRFQNYVDVFTLIPFHRFYFNSVYISFVVVAGTVFFASLAGYAFAKIPFTGRNAVFLVLLSAMMIPHEVTAIPMFLSMRDLGWIDTHLPLILLPIFGAGGVFGIFVMRQFFITIPTELEEAAMIDGCNRFRIYWKIMLPIARPGMATLTIFTFVTIWNEFFDPLIFINTRELMTLPLGLSLFTDEVGTSWHYLMSATVMATVPLLIVFFLAQKRFIEGVAMTGLKE
ncbi:carbohydrate ABC transporter permease [Paenibacillus tritici]|uniref:Carbohydrate ABC transporter permease n=1 Tax=Paenibacillus tritici TaxID=1873425 RepID=A0ABX2DXI6_9BACL|nr:carbohydrate ABC transporter permease [Paenibacillus tritici]